MNIFGDLWQDLSTISKQLGFDQAVWKYASLEIPKDLLNGDIATNIAMIIATKYASSPREIALKFKEHLLNLPYIAHVEIAGPGFINMTIRAEKWHACIQAILKEDPKFWDVNIGHGEKVNIEYVSANPTGPMHIGHARGAVYGDALANILTLCGYEVTKEYYVNDAGGQIDTLLDSAYLRYKEAMGEAIVMPEGFYPGEYLKVVGQELFSQFGQQLVEMTALQRYHAIKQTVITAMLNLIKADLADLGVHHHVFFSEQSLHDGGQIEQAIDVLNKKGVIYQGVLPPPKGKIDDNWQEKKQLLFRSSQYGDEQDRPLQKNDGSWSYLAADFAYAKNKIDRGYGNLIYILGADHSGYVKRISAVIDALSDGKVKSNIKVTQLVNFIKDGNPIKMSKRSGNFQTVRDVLNEVNGDIIRFIMLTRRNDVSLDFDLDLVKKQSKDNPVFYVQYAYVRAGSIIAKAQTTIPMAYNCYINDDLDLSLLSSEEEIQLIKMLASWPKVLASAAKACEPHKIAYYLIDIASLFHSIWNLGQENNQYRFNNEHDIALTAARLGLAESIRKVLATGFKVIGITPMQRM